jgi:O-succinylbenzoic acid--CoA ligase
VERIIADHFTLPFIITRKKDEKFGEVVVMVIESTDVSTMDVARKVCQDSLPKYWQPRDYMVVEKLPRTETGKVKR